VQAVIMHERGGPDVLRQTGRHLGGDYRPMTAFDFDPATSVSEKAGKRAVNQ
jgi:hypothetical protein